MRWRHVAILLLAVGLVLAILYVPRLLERRDSDQDGLYDDEEEQLGTDPLDPDTDGDGLPDRMERDIFRTNPLVPDTDGDGLPDGWEAKALAAYPGAPLDPSGPLGGLGDPDGDTLTNLEEMALDTDPTRNDTDVDGVRDDIDRWPRDNVVAFVNLTFYEVSGKYSSNPETVYLNVTGPEAGRVFSRKGDPLIGDTATVNNITVFFDLPDDQPPPFVLTVALMNFGIYEGRRDASYDIGAGDARSCTVDLVPSRDTPPLDLTCSGVPDGLPGDYDASVTLFVFTSLQIHP